MIRVLASLAAGLVLAARRLIGLLRGGFAVLMIIGLLATNIATLIFPPMFNALSGVVDWLVPDASVHSQITRRLAQAEADLVTTRRSATTLETQIADLDRRAATAEADKVALTRDRSVLQTDLDVRAQRLTAVEAELQSVNVQRAALTDELGAVRRQADSAAAQVASLQRQTRTLRADLDAGSRQIADLDTERLRLGTALQDSQINYRNTLADNALMSADLESATAEKLARVQRIDRVTARILRRNAITAERTIGSAALEWAPVIGNTINYLGMALDLSDMCVVSSDMVTLRQDLALGDPLDADKNRVCGLQIPTMAELTGQSRDIDPATLLRRCMTLAETGNVDPDLACPALLPGQTGDTVLASPAPLALPPSTEEAAVADGVAAETGLPPATD